MLEGIVYFVIGLLLGKFLVRVEVRKLGSFSVWLIGIPTLIFIGLGGFKVVTSLFAFYDFQVGYTLFTLISLLVLFILIKLYHSELKRERLLYELEKEKFGKIE